MAKVYDVAVSFKRSVQPKEYETAVAEVSLKAQTEDGEDHVVLLAQLGEDARNGALNMLKGKFDATTRAMPTDIATAKATPKEEPKAEPKAEAPKSNGDASGMPDEGEAEKPKRTRGPNKKKAEAASSMPDEDGPPAEEISSSSDMPDEGEPAATNGSADMPDEGEAAGEDWENAAPEAEEKLTAADVTAFISKQVQASKITVPDVKAILAKWGGARVGDIDPAKLPQVKAAILADCKA